MTRNFIRFLMEAVSEHKKYKASKKDKRFRGDKSLAKSVKTIEAILSVPPSKRTEEQTAILRHRYNAHIIKVAAARKGQWLNWYPNNGYNLWQAHLKSDSGKTGAFVMAYATKGEDVELLVIGTHDDTTGG